MVSTKYIYRAMVKIGKTNNTYEKYPFGSIKMDTKEGHRFEHDINYNLQIYYLQITPSFGLQSRLFLSIF